MISLHKPICLGRTRRKIDVVDDNDNGVNMHYVYGLRPCAPEFIAPQVKPRSSGLFIERKRPWEIIKDLCCQSMNRFHHYRYCYVRRITMKLAAIFEYYSVFSYFYFFNYFIINKKMRERIMDKFFNSYNFQFLS